MRSWLVPVLAAALLLPACHRRERTGSKKGHAATSEPAAAGGPPSGGAAGAEPHRPPALTRALARPDLPDLPALEAHPRAEAPPPRGPDVTGCGHVWSGSAWVPVSCIDPGVYRPPTRMAKVVVPY